MPNNSAWAVILAAGKGRRLAEACGGSAKQFLNWQGLPLWWHSAKVFAASPLIRGLVFVFPKDRLTEAQADLSRLDQQDSLGLPWLCVAGGEKRQDSVRLGLAALPQACEEVLIHDSARPFLSPELISTVLGPLRQDTPEGEEPFLGVIPGLPLTDTIKEVLPDGSVLRTPARSFLRAVQTPQAFKLPALRAAHARVEAEGVEVTDDASVMEYCGHRVLVAPGEIDNKKITLPEDLALLAPPFRRWPCSGYGYDVHRYGGNRPLRLGGILIPGAELVVAHSDGDVLLHALMDAILGCVGLGDIGQHFPDKDPAWENVSSSLLLEKVLEMAAEKDFWLTQADLTIIAQRPRIAPHAQNIRRNVARLLGLPENRVNVKATTEEGLGFTGQGQGLKAVALVSGMR